MIVRELVTNLGFKADNRSAQRYERTVDDVRRTAARAAVAIGAISTAATALVTSFVRSSSETVSWANRLGIATDELQRLQFAAGRYNVTNEALIDGLKEASLRADEFITTGVGGGAEAFERLGIGAEELNRVSGDTAALFELIQRRIQEVDNVAARQRIADEIFGGQAGEQFTEFLGAGREETERLGRLADQMGAIVPEESLKNARQLGMEYNTLTSVFKGLSAQAASALLPIFQDVVDSTLAWLKANREIILQNISTFVRSFAMAVRGAWNVVSGIAGAIDSVVESTVGWERFLRLVVIALGAMVALKVSRWVWVLAGAFTSLKKVMLLLSRVPIIAAFTAIIFVIDDFIAWINDGESAIGSLFMSFEEFRVKIAPVVDSIMATLGGLGDVLMGIFTLDVGRIMDGFRELGRQFKKWVRGFATNTQQLLFKIPGYEAFVRQLDRGIEEATTINPALQVDPRSDISAGMPGAGARAAQRSQAQVNARTEVTLQVPAGTPDSQRAYIESVAERTFAEHWNREISKAMWDFQPSE